MGSEQSDVSRGLQKDRFPTLLRAAPARSRTKPRVLVVENEKGLRDTMGQLLDEAGYEVAFADNGRAALTVLGNEAAPDLIMLDLNMPVMDGWEFRTIQKDDPKLGIIPVLAISADASPKAAAISAQGYLRKPFDSEEMLLAIARVLKDDAERVSARQDETERLASLGRVAANVGHEINNPLAFVMLNLRQSMSELEASVRSLASGRALPEADVANLRAGLSSVTEMLRECETGGDRIGATVANLQRLSHRTVADCGRVDLHELLEQSAAMAGNQIRHRARLTKRFGDAAVVRGDRAALGQVFLNLLVNAVQSIPEGNADRNDIVITTTMDASSVLGPAIVVEISDTGGGIAPDIVARVFEPYFTTKALGEGTGLGLSISRQTILDHGGRMTVESKVGEGTSFRVSLPIDQSPPVPSPLAPRTVAERSEPPTTLRRGRILVIDDEPLVGRILRASLKREHEVVVVQCAAEALAILNEGDEFDLVLCDLMMPDVGGAEFYATLRERWPLLVSRVVFMTGGAFTPRAAEFMRCVPTSVLSKPFELDELRRIVREHIRGDS